MIENNKGLRQSPCSTEFVVLIGSERQPFDRITKDIFPIIEAITCTKGLGTPRRRSFLNKMFLSIRSKAFLKSTKPMKVFFLREKLVAIMSLSRRAADVVEWPLLNPNWKAGRILHCST